MNEMTRTSAADFQAHLPEFLSRAAVKRNVINVSTEDGDVVLLSLERFRQLERDAGNAEYLRKIDEGFAEIRAGNGIVKTMEEHSP